MGMASFHNFGPVDGQVGNQHVHGGIHHYHFDSATQDRTLQSQRDGFDSDTQKSLDNAILASLAYPEMFYRRSDIHQPHRTTVQWIFELDQYVTWTSQPSGLLWIKGKPGAGKSTLTAHLHRTIRRESSNSHTLCLDFFFTARGSPLQRTTFGMLRSLLNQLFYHDESIRDVLRIPYREKQGSLSSGQRNWEWRQPELQTLFTEAVLMAVKLRPLIVFVDALDEAGEQSAREMAYYFHNLNDQFQQQSSLAKICISCRHYPVLPRCPTVEIFVEDHNQSDIAAYVHSHLSIPAISLDGDNHSTQWDDLVRDMVDTARGVFQWICLVVPEVEKFILQGHSPERIQQWLAKVPDELGHMYRHIIGQLTTQDHTSLSHRLFQWVCLATRPLSVTEIQHALSCYNILSPISSSECHDIKHLFGDEKIMRMCIRSWSGGLVEVAVMAAGQPAVVQPIHHSVNDYLLTEGLALFARLDAQRSDPASLPVSDTDAAETVASCHGELYGCCVSYIIEKAAQFVFPYSGNYDLSRYFEFKSETNTRFPFLEYASSNCLAHAREAGDHRSHDLRKESSTFEGVVPVLLEAWKLYKVKLGQSEGLEAGAKPLHVAAFVDLTELAQGLLDRETDVDAVDARGQTALHLAAREGHLATARMLIINKANLQKRATDGRTPLHWAARGGHATMFSWLLSRNRRLDSNPGLLGSVLLDAVARHRVTIVELCIEAGADVNIRQRGEYASALQQASHRGFVRIVQILLKAGADVNARGGTYNGALQAAAASFHSKTAIVEMLLDAGAKVNAPGGQFGNPLEAALMMHNRKVARVLLDAGAKRRPYVQQDSDSGLALA